jgi:hypothetical protein
MDISSVSPYMIRLSEKVKGLVATDRIKEILKENRIDDNQKISLPLFSKQMQSKG